MSGEHIDYGVDAPGVIRGMLIAGSAGVTAGAAATALGSRPVRWVGALLALGSAAPLGLGLAMVGYTRAGKYRLRDWMLARHRWRGDERVLDVGAGRGLMAIGAARLLTSGRVTALDVWRAEDLSDNGAEQLRANAIAAGVDSCVDIVTGDARALSLDTGSVDVVLSVLCLHNIEPAADRDEAVREIARVLAPGGRALLADYQGTARYATVLRDAGCVVESLHNLVRFCRSLMWVVEARKPDFGASAV